MKPVSQSSLRMTPPGAKAPVSRVRTQFNTLIKKIDAARARLRAWQDVMPMIMRQADQELHPLAVKYAERQRELVLMLDAMYRKEAFSKRERLKLDDLIAALAEELLEQTDDEEIKRIYNRATGCDFDAEEEEDKAAFKEMLAESLGLPPDADLDLDSPEAIAAAMAQLRERDSREREAAHEKAAARRKPAKELAREQREAAEADKLKQTVREIFRKLASELHPDREADPVERERKTGLMQRVNVAYAANDLLGLLELQLEIEQIDQSGLDRLDEDRIKQFNKILTGQLQEIEREAYHLEYAVEADLGWHGRKRLTPKVLMQELRADIVAMQARLNAIAADLVAFSDVKKLRAWLKTIRTDTPQAYDDGPYF